MWSIINLKTNIIDLEEILKYENRQDVINLYLTGFVCSFGLQYILQGPSFLSSSF